jgi:hypothetical protein
MTVWRLQQTAGARPEPWTVAQIHDTVAKIASQPAYAASVRESLLGRFLRYVLDRVASLLAWLSGSIDARIALIVAVVLVAAVIVLRVVVARQLREGRGRLGLTINSMSVRADLWALARDEAAAARYVDACHAVYAAVIDTFARQGFLAVHESKTSGDYARDLRRAAAPVVADFRSFARQFDRAVFGTATVGADDYARLRESAERAARIRVSS